MDVRVSRSLTIPRRELKISFETSGGPGGQHANKAATRVVLEWDVAGSASLGPRQRARLLERLPRRIDSSGTLRVTSDRFRSQTRNRDDAMERLAALVRDALRPVAARVATQPTIAARERRLQAKRRRSEVKRRRGRVELD